MPVRAARLLLTPPLQTIERELPRASSSRRKGKHAIEYRYGRRGRVVVINEGLTDLYLSRSYATWLDPNWLNTKERMRVEDMDGGDLPIREDESWTSSLLDANGPKRTKLTGLYLNLFSAPTDPRRNPFTTVREQGSIVVIPGDGDESAWSVLWANTAKEAQQMVEDRAASWELESHGVGDGLLFAPTRKLRSCPLPDWWRKGSPSREKFSPGNEAIKLQFSFPSDGKWVERVWHDVPVFVGDHSVSAALFAEQAETRLRKSTVLKIKKCRWVLELRVQHRHALERSLAADIVDRERKADLREITGTFSDGAVTAVKAAAVAATALDAQLTRLRSAVARLREFIAENGGLRSAAYDAVTRMQRCIEFDGPDVEELKVLLKGLASDGEEGMENYQTTTLKSDWPIERQLSDAQKRAAASVSFVDEMRAKADERLQAVVAAEEAWEKSAMGRAASAVRGAVDVGMGAGRGLLDKLYSWTGHGEESKRPPAEHEQGDDALDAFEDALEPEDVGNEAEAKDRDGIDWEAVMRDETNFDEPVPDFDEPVQMEGPGQEVEKVAAPTTERGAVEVVHEIVTRMVAAATTLEEQMAAVAQDPQIFYDSVSVREAGTALPEAQEKVAQMEGREAARVGRRKDAIAEQQEYRQQRREREERREEAERERAHKEEVRLREAMRKAGESAARQRAHVGRLEENSVRLPARREAHGRPLQGRERTHHATRR